MNEQEVQEAFGRFVSPLLSMVAADNRDQAEILAKFLWMGLIGGPKVEKEVWKTIEEMPGMPADDLDAVRRMYLTEMKPAVLPDELKAVREHYVIDPRRAMARITVAQRQLFEEVELPARPADPEASPSPSFVHWAVSGAACGGVVGSVLASVEAARTAALIGAIGLGLVATIAGVVYGSALSPPNRRLFGAVGAGLILAVLGSLLGAFAGAAAATAVGAIPGAIVGVVVGRKLLPNSSVLFRALIGAGTGAVSVALTRDQGAGVPAALGGALAGTAGAGLIFVAVVGIVIVLAKGFAGRGGAASRQGPACRRRRD